MLKFTPNCYNYIAHIRIKINSLIEGSKMRIKLTRNLVAIWLRRSLSSIYIFIFLHEMMVILYFDTSIGI